MKASKDDANYRRGTPEKHCANCKHYREASAGAGSCTKVAGTIGPKMMSDYYEKKSS